MWTFLNPLFLWAAAAAVVPLVLHLIHRRRIVKIRFSTVRFLKLAQKRSSSRIRLENLLLWLLRTALLLLLALAFAGPVLRTQGFAGLIGTTRRDVAIVWDASYSMSYESGFTRVWESSREIVSSIVQGLKKGDRVSIFLASDTVIPLIEQPSSDLALALSLVKAQDVRPATSQILPALRAACDSLKDSGRGEREVYIVTDGQAVPWRDFAGDRGAPRGAAAPTNAPPLAKADAGAKESPPKTAGEAWDPKTLSQELTFFAVLVGVDKPENIAPLSVEVEPRAVMAGRPARVSATLGFNGPSRNTSISLYIDDREIARRTATLGAGDDAATFNVPPLEAGVHVARVEAPADAVTLDDAFYFLLRVKAELPVLCCGSDADTFFLTRAMNPGGAGSGINAKRVSPAALAAENLGAYACIFLCNAIPVPGQALLGLERYVKGGGVLVIFPGERAGAADYETWRCLPAKNPTVVNVEAADRNRTLRLLKPDDPLFASLKLPPGTLRRRLAFDTLEPDSSAVIAAGSDDPFLLSRQFGKGRVLLFAATADRNWSDFPLSPFFLPILHQIVQFSSGIDSQRLFAWAARSVSLTDVLPDTAENANLLSPKGTLLPIRKVKQGDREDWMTENVAEAGIYRLKTADADAQPLLAVNIDRKESELTPIPSRELPDLVQIKGLNVARDKDELARLIAEHRIGRPLNETFLWLALLVASIELWIASRASRRQLGLSGQMAVEASGRVKSMV